MNENKVLGIDVGGTSIKAALVDICELNLLSKLVTIETLDPKNCKSIATQITSILKEFGNEPKLIVGCTLPSVIKSGIVKSASNIHAEWIGVNLEQWGKKSLNRNITFINDCDAAALAESAGPLSHLFNKPGCLFLTIGTGIGSSFFSEGHLFPNTEIGHLTLPDGREAEKIASAKYKHENNLSWKEWCVSLNQVLRFYEKIFNPDCIVIGGGFSEYWSTIHDHIQIETECSKAHFGNEAGVIGAALHAFHHSKLRTNG